MPNAPQSYRAYHQTSIGTADQLTLIIMLYEGLERFLKKAQVKIRENNIEEAHNYLVRSKDIVNELLSTLKVDQGGDVGQNLKELYLFLFKKIAEANIKKDAKIVNEILTTVTTLRRGWTELKEKRNQLKQPEYNQKPSEKRIRVQG